MATFDGRRRVSACCGSRLIGMRKYRRGGVILICGWEGVEVPQVLEIMTLFKSQGSAVSVIVGARARPFGRKTSVKSF